MIRSERRKLIAIVAIAAVVLLAVAPAGVAAVIIFEDDFESGNLAKWSSGGEVEVTNNITYAPAWGGSYVKFSGNDTKSTTHEIVAEIDTTCMKNISLSFARKTVGLNDGNDAFTVRYDNDSSTGENLAIYTDSLDWPLTLIILPLPPDAENNPLLRIKFVLSKGSDTGEYAFLDNVTVTGEPMVPALEVNKTVWNGTAWVKSLNASFNDTLQFKCTITNTGEVNLTQLRFWDILDCSLQFADWPYLLPCDSYMFKPKVLHTTSCWDPRINPIDETFTELCPAAGTSRHVEDWKDTNHDGNVSACDQIYLTSAEPKWYHVDRVPYTLNLSNATYGSKYFDSVLNWDEMDLLTDPINSTWLEVCCCKDRYTLIGWNGDCPSVGIIPGDNVTLRNERTLEEVQYTVTSRDFDLVVSREWDLTEWGAIQLKPTETITIFYNATVVRCGVDNNTFVAKGMGCGDNWTYSDPDVVTITVPCPSGDAADDTPAIKDVYYEGEPVYALGSGFAPNTLVDIYIFNDRKWLGGEDLTAIAPLYASAPGKQVDPNGSIGINPLVLVWANSVPGEYDMVFDANQNHIYEPFIDAVDDPNHPGLIVLGRVPLITPLGIVVLIGLLSLIATSTLVRKRKN